MAKTVFETNAEQVLNDLSKRLKRLRAYDIDEYVKIVGEVFIERAKEKLLSAYPKATKEAEDILLERSGISQYTISFGNGSNKQILLFLEYGTGYVGRENPHPMASDVGWEYAVNENGTRKSQFSDMLLPMHFDLTKPIGQQGIYSNIKYPDITKGAKGWVYKDKETGSLKVTSGLKAVSFVYDTLQEMETVKKIARRRFGGEQSILRRRIVRK